MLNNSECFGHPMEGPLRSSLYLNPFLAAVESSHAVSVSGISNEPPCLFSLEGVWSLGGRLFTDDGNSVTPAGGGTLPVSLWHPGSMNLGEPSWHPGLS